MKYDVRNDQLCKKIWSLSIINSLFLFPALDRLETMLRKRESEASADAAEVLRLQVDSPSQCEVSSPDDGKSLSALNSKFQMCLHFTST